jgi:RNA recognition motif-containing protein
MEGSKLYVGNLKYSCTTDELQQLFGEFGAVKDITIIEGKGFGFVELSSSQEAEAAKEALNGKEFLGRTLRVNEAFPPKKKARRDFNAPPVQENPLDEDY